MAITQSIIKLYSDQAMTQLIGTYTDTGNDQHEVLTGLTPGTQYWLTVESENSYGNWSNPKQGTFYTIPQVNLTGVVNKGDTSFLRPVSETTTTAVPVSVKGLEYATDNLFSDAIRVPNYTVTGLTENTTYYYRPWCRDIFGREWVNTSDVDSVTTMYSVPQVLYKSISGASLTTFDCTITVNSLDTVSSVYAELSTSGVTTTIPLTAATGDQHVVLTGLSPNTNYDIQIFAVNSSGTGSSVLYNFTTLQQTGVMDVILRSGQLVDPSDNSVTASCDVSYDHDEVTLVSNSVYIYDDASHSGNVIDFDSGSTDSFTAYLTNLADDETYYVFGKAEYTVGSDPTVYTEWSTPVQIHTYSLLSFISITPGNDNCQVVFTVSGNSTNTQVEYSIDNVTFIQVPVVNPQGDTLTITGLTPNTNYYLRGRAQNQAGWQTYVEDTFTTTGVVPLGIHLNNISNISGSGATVNLTIS